MTDLDGDGICDNEDYTLVLNPNVVEEFENDMIVWTPTGWVPYPSVWSYIERILPDGATIILESGSYGYMLFGLRNTWYALPGSYHQNFTWQSWDGRVHLNVKAADGADVWVETIRLEGALTMNNSYSFENLNISEQFINKGISTIPIT